jgi:hypothetical protein
MFRWIQCSAGILVELQQYVEVVGDHGDRLEVLGAVVELEGLDRDLGLVDVLGVVDFLERGQRTRCADFGSAASTLACLWVLCRRRHKTYYADVRVMPICRGPVLVAGVNGLAKSA